MFKVDKVVKIKVLNVITCEKHGNEKLSKTECE